MTHSFPSKRSAAARLCAAGLAFGLLAACDAGFGGKADPVIASRLGPNVDALATGAERRLVIAAEVSRISEQTTEQPETGTKKVTFLLAKEKDLVVCAEPSPDAIEALSASLAAKIEASRADNSQAKAELTKDITTSIGSVLRRTQGLQLFRDGVFALCQGSMNGLRDSVKIVDAFNDLTDVASRLIMKEISSPNWNSAPVIVVSPDKAPTN